MTANNKSANKSVKPAMALNNDLDELATLSLSDLIASENDALQDLNIAGLKLEVLASDKEATYADKVRLSGNVVRVKQTIAQARVSLRKSVVTAKEQANKFARTMAVEQEKTAREVVKAGSKTATGQVKAGTKVPQSALNKVAKATNPSQPATSSPVTTL